MSSAAGLWGSLTMAIVAYFVYLKRHQQSRASTAAAASAAAGASSAAAPAPSASSSAASGSAAPSAREKEKSSKSYKGQKLKMVLCVRNDLGMGQCAWPTRGAGPAEAERLRLSPRASHRAAHSVAADVSV